MTTLFQTGIHIIIEAWFVCLMAALGFLYVFYGTVRRRDSLADLCGAIMQYLCIGLVLTILSCLVATFDLPLFDGAFVKADTYLKLDWMAVFNLVYGHPWLNALLSTAYSSIPAQTALIFLWLNITKRFERIREFISILAITLSLTVIISTIVPAAGAFVAYDVDAKVQANYVKLFLGLRDGSIHDLPLSKIDGIVQFPSFHVVLAIQFVYSARGVRWLFPIMLVTNAIMIASTPVIGGHHFVDVIAGAVVAAIAIYGWRYGSDRGRRTIIAAT